MEVITIAEAAYISKFDRNVIYELFEDGAIEGYQRKPGAKNLECTPLLKQVVKLR